MSTPSFNFHSTPTFNGNSRKKSSIIQASLSSSHSTINISATLPGDVRSDSMRLQILITVVTIGAVILILVASVAICGCVFGRQRRKKRIINETDNGYLTTLINPSEAELKNSTRSIEHLPYPTGAMLLKAPVCPTINLPKNILLIGEPKEDQISNNLGPPYPTIEMGEKKSSLSTMQQQTIKKSSSARSMISQDRSSSEHILATSPESKMMPTLPVANVPVLKLTGSIYRPKKVRSKQTDNTQSTTQSIASAKSASPLTTHPLGKNADARSVSSRQTSYRRHKSRTRRDNIELQTPSSSSTATVVRSTKSDDCRNVKI
ncbi:hypothetical protein SNEBB_010867 [Seison nebaliae]|nr:hypothetical protein SNEBB_010867 [Seison nebaliae]